MKRLEDFADIHSHRRTDGDDGERVVNIAPGEETEDGRGAYSVGIHPWATDKPVDAATIEALRIAAADPRVVAIGETGIDALRGGSADYQEEIFRLHARLAEELGKPLIIHAVRSFPRLIGLRKELKPSARWIIHGFRGKAALARELLRHGFDLSFGEHFNAEAAAAVPDDRKFYETDESDLTIEEIKRRINGL